MCAPDLSQRVNSVKEENHKLKAENEVGLLPCLFRWCFALSASLPFTLTHMLPPSPLSCWTNTLTISWPLQRSFQKRLQLHPLAAAAARKNSPHEHKQTSQSQCPVFMTRMHGFLLSCFLSAATVVVAQPQLAVRVHVVERSLWL